MQPTEAIVAAFDFDGTLTRKDSFLEFIKHCFGVRRFITGMLIMSPILVLYKLKIIANSRAKQAVFSHFFEGMTKRHFNEHCHSFKSKIDRFVRQEAIEKLEFHLSEHHKVVIVSASIENWIQPWAVENRIDLIIGTQAEFVSDKLTGRFSSPNCFGPQKEIRLKKEFPNLHQKTLYAYGDSKGDKDLLRIADHSFYRKF